MTPREIRCGPSHVLFVVCSVAAAPAAAQNSVPGSDAVSRGTYALEHQQYEAAVRELQTAYGQDPQAITLYDLAVAYRGAGRIADAVRAFETYLRSPEPNADPARLRAIAQVVAQLREHSAAIAVRTVPVGAEITLDGRNGVDPSRDVLIDPGVHTVEVHAAGFVPVRRTVSIGAAEHRVIDVALVPASAAPPPSPTTRTASVHVPGGAVLLGAAALAFGFAAIAYYGLAAPTFDQIRSTCNPQCDPAFQGRYAAARSFALAADGSDALGIALVAGGSLWLLIDLLGSRRRASVTVSPTAGGLVLRGAF